MLLTSMVSDYEALCEEVARRGDAVKLLRGRHTGSSWGLQVLVRPAPHRRGWRAAGVLFPDLGELELHARYLRAWLERQ